MTPVSDPSNTIHPKKSRLKFIDMARSLAILMMLEGHFTGAALSKEYRDGTYWLFEAWYKVHGLTAPLFFTVSGVIFAYLLVSKDSSELKFWENIRVRKGLRRILQLIFWGYFVKLNISAIIESSQEGNKINLDSLYGFHVLQCIGVSLLLVILIYRIYKWLRFGQLYWYYLIAGTTVFVLLSILLQYIATDVQLVQEGVRESNHYWPQGAPRFIQNIFYGPYWQFSIVRMSGFTLFGAMIGVLVHHNEDKVKEWWFGLTFIILGTLVAIFAQNILELIDQLLQAMGLIENEFLSLTAVLVSRLGQVVGILGVIILIDKLFKVNAPLFLKIGQTTFPIFVLHVIILYGGIFGYGLKPEVFDRNLSPWFAILISASAIGLFALFVHYIDPFTRAYNQVVYTLRLKKRPKD